MLTCEGEICPVIKKIVDKTKKDANGWSPNWCGYREYSTFFVSDMYNHLFVYNC